MTVTFSLKPTMTRKQFLAEIKGQISGETQLLVRELTRNISDDSRLPKLTIKVDEHRKMAIVRVIHARDQLGLPTLRQYTYVLGVNDEGLYFCHQISSSQVPDTATTIEGVVDWMNRVDEGFTRRLQGDILMQMVDVIKATPPQSNDQHSYTGHGSVTFHYRAVEGSAITELTPRSLGNHSIITDGLVMSAFVSGLSGNVVIVAGTSQMTLQHPQHGEVTVQIPPNQGVLLSTQRGRQFSSVIVD